MFTYIILPLFIWNSQYHKNCKFARNSQARYNVLNQWRAKSSNTPEDVEKLHNKIFPSDYFLDILRR